MSKSVAGVWNEITRQFFKVAEGALICGLPVQLVSCCQLRGLVVRLRVAYFLLGASYSPLGGTCSLQ